MTPDKNQEAVEKLRPYRELYRNAISALDLYARAYEALGIAIHDFIEPKLNFSKHEDSYGITAKHVFKLHQRAVDAMFADLEEMVRSDLDDRDFFEGPVSEAKVMFLQEENERGQPS